MARANLENFYNDGFGWICRTCEGARKRSAESVSRLLSEGESEGTSPELSTKALAKWADDERTELKCPGCGIRERFTEK